MGTHPIFESDFDCLTDFQKSGMSINGDFSVEEFKKKIEKHLDKSQEKVQEISRWLIKHHDSADLIAKTWLRILIASETSSQKKSLIYLANDLLQNGAKKGANFTDYFLPRLPIAFASFGICDERLLKSLMNVLQVWENRNVFQAEYIKGLRNALFAEQRKHLDDDFKELESTRPIIDSKYTPLPLSDLTALKSKIEMKRRKRKRDKKIKKIKRKRIEPIEEINVTVDLSKLNHEVQQLSEDPASSDSKTREKLAALPMEVQDETIIEHVKDEKTLKLLYEL